MTSVFGFFRQQLHQNFEKSMYSIDKIGQGVRKKEKNPCYFIQIALYWNYENV